jgi:hypothetical protein
MDFVGGTLAAFMVGLIVAPDLHQVVQSLWW